MPKIRARDNDAWAGGCNRVTPPHINLGVCRRVPETSSAECQLKNPEWGIKHICQHCQAKYYDLNRDPITCPKCKTEFDATVGLKSRGETPFKPYTPRGRQGPTRATPLGLVESEPRRAEASAEGDEDAEPVADEDEDEEEGAVPELSALDREETSAEPDEMDEASETMRC